MTDKDPLSEEERQQLDKLRERQQLQNYREKVENLDTIPANAIEYTKTGVDEYDTLSPEPRYRWLEQLEHYSGKPLDNDNVLVSNSGTVHFIAFWKESWEDEYPVPFCKSAQMNGEVVPVEDVSLTEEKYCKTCLKNKKNMRAAQIAVWNS